MAYLNKSQQQYVSSRYNMQKNSVFNNALPQIIGAAGQLGSTWLQNRQQQKNVTQTNVANKEMAEYAYEKDLEMWHRQNRYNSPEAQMARFKAAGLNPNLMYGQGSPGNAQGAPQFQAPRMDYRGVQPVADPGAMVQTYFDTRQKRENINYTAQQTEVQIMQEALMATKETGMFQDNTIRAVEATLARKIMNDWTGRDMKEIADARIGGMKAEAWLKKAAAEIKQWEAELTRSNINPRDSVAIRYAVDLFKTLGFTKQNIKKYLKGTATGASFLGSFSKSEQ